MSHSKQHIDACDFSPICLASIEYIEVLNLSDKDELHIFSVASESAHFHASFKHTVLPPRANLSIPVVFLAKVLGPAETSLVIQTNLGGFIYQVSGVGVPNQYAVEPLVGVKVLVQHWYSAPITLYNPTSDTLVVKEVFTSGGFLHLSLPGSVGTPVDNRRLWELTPYQRKQIINLDFQAANAGKYQGFIYIKTDRDMLIVHVEVTVVKSALQLTVDELDFGTLTALQHRHSATDLTAPLTRSVTLTLLNGHAHAVHVHELTLSALQNDPNIAAKIDLKIDFHGPMDLAPLTSRDIGTVTFAAKVDGVYRGKLAVKTNDTAQARIELPFKARVIGGHVIPELASTTFPISVKGPPFSAVVQPIQLTNKLATPFTVLTAELNDPLFRITHLTPVSSVPVNSTWSGVTVSFTANSTQSHRSELILRTNITTLHVPLTSYSGRLHCAVTGAALPRLVSFGVVSVGESAHKTLTLHNPNPVAIAVLQINSDLAGLAVTLDHVTDTHGDTQHLSRVLSSGPRAKGELKEPLFSIESNSTAQLSVALSPHQEELREGRMHIRTSHETLRLNVSYHALHGSLRIEPHSLTFDEPAFPGLRLHHSIMAHNSFARAINISHMHANDPRFIPVVEKRVVQPNVMTKIGYLTFDPALAPHHYMLHTSTATSDALTSEELEARQSLDAMWQHVLDEHSEQITAQLTVHTDVAVTPVLAVHASLTRPSILHSTTLDYGLTQLHTQRTQYIVLHNPSDQPVHVQLLPLTGAVSWWRRVQAWLWQQEAEFYYPAECTTTALLAPHRQVKLGPLIYVPHHLGVDEITVTVRNNLTVYEQIKVIGQGGSGHLTLHQGHGHSAAVTPATAVVLHLDTKQLARCARGSTSGINVTHSFQLVNDGTLPLKVDALGIDADTCETEDFKLHNCKPFSLSPTQTHNLTVTFTPDFSAATVRRDLVLFTDHGTYSFPLVAHMPPAEVQLCAEVQAPHSAQVAHTARTLFIAFCFCMFVFFVVIIVQEYRYQPQGPRYSDKSVPEDIEQDTKRPTPVTTPTAPAHLAHPTPTPTTPKSPSKHTRDRRETLPEPALTLPSMTLESSHVTPASTPLTTTSASPKKAAVTLNTSAANTNTASTANKSRGRSNSKGQRGKIDPQAPFTITTAVPVTPTTEHKPKPAKTRAHTAPDTAASADVTPVTHTSHLTTLITPVTAAVTSSVTSHSTVANTTLTPVTHTSHLTTLTTPVTAPVTSHTPEVPVPHNTTLTAVTPLTPAPTVTPVTTTLTALATDKPAARPATEDRPPRTKNVKPPSNNVPPYHRGPKRSPKSWVRKDEKQNAEAKQSATESPVPAVDAVKSEEHTDTADRSNNSTTIAKKEYVKTLYKPAPRVTGVKTPSPSHSPDTSSTRSEGKAVRKSPLPVSPILTTTPLSAPSLESAASEFSYLEHYYPEIEGTELVYNSIAALTGTSATNTAATFNTNLAAPAPSSPHNRSTVRDPFSFGALDQRIHTAQSRAHPPPHGTIGSVKPRAFDPWDRPILFDLDGDSSQHVVSHSPPTTQYTSPHSPPSDTWTDTQHTSPSLFTALPPLFAAPSQHSFFSSPTFPRVSKSSDDVITPPRPDPAVNPLSTSVSSLTAYNPFNGGSLFAMSESPFTPFAPYPHTSSFGSFNLQNLSQLRNGDSTHEPHPAADDA